MKKGPESGTWPLAGVPSKLAESNPDNSRSGGASAKEKAVLSSPGEAENAQLKPSRETPRKKLCGYLNKLGIKGPIKTWKSRWFIYDENKCHLLYYRTAQDVNPLGSIDLSSASFDCKVENGEGVFEIRTPSRVFTLKVSISIFFWGWCRTFCIGTDTSLLTYLSVSFTLVLSLCCCLLDLNCFHCFCEAGIPLPVR